MFTVLSGFSGPHPLAKGGYIERKAEDFVFTKTNRRNLANNVIVEGASLCAKFSIVEECNPETLDDTYNFVKRMGKEPHKVCIRGKYKEKFKSVARRGELVEWVSSNIFMVDVDSLPLDGIVATDLEEQAKKVVGILNALEPEIFPLDIGYVVQASSSAAMRGDEGNIKLHIFFQNECSISSNQIKYLATSINSKYKQEYEDITDLLDPAVYSVVQPHYLSEPLFEGVEDPFKELDRVLIIPGETTKVPANTPAYKVISNVDMGNAHEFFGRMTGKFDPPDPVLQAINTVKEWDPMNSGLRRKVLSLYHKAIQEFYDIDKLDREILPYIEEKRPGQGRQYIAEAKDVALKRFVALSARELPDEVEGLEIKTLPSEESDYYLKIANPPPENSLTFLRASLGTGKTTTVEEWIKFGKITGKFLTITNTVALVESNATRFGAGDFRKKKDLLAFSAGKTVALSGTIHSLHKLEPFVDSFDFIFIDEADAVMNDILFSGVIKGAANGGYREKIIETLYKLMLSTSIVVLSDGDLSTETIKAYGKLIDYSTPMYKVDHIKETLANATAYQHMNPNSLWGALKESLLIGDKCLLVSDLGPDQLNKKQLALEELTGKNIKCIHRNSREDADIKEIINRPREAPKEQLIDCLLCSPTLTNGVDFGHFDSVFVLTETSNQPPNLRYQALRRDREATTIHYYFARIRGYNTGAKTHIFHQGWEGETTNLLCERRERECAYYENTFQYYLLREGCSIDTIHDPFDGLPTMSDIYLEQRINAILSATSNYKVPRHNDAFEVKESILYYYDLDSLSYEDVERYLDEKPDKCMEFLHKVFLKFWPAIKSSSEKGSVKPLLEELKTKSFLFFKLTGEEPRLTLWKCKGYMKKFGFNKLYDNLDLVIAWYMKYLEYHNLPIPEILVDKKEEANEIV